MGRPKKDMVNHPKHYNLEGRDECIVEMEDIFGVQNVAIWCYMTSYKYIYRAGNKDKNRMEEDIEKAVWYFKYVDKLAEKWKVEAFDVRLRQLTEKLIVDAKRKMRQQKQKNESNA